MSRAPIRLARLGFALCLALWMAGCSSIVQGVQHTVGLSGGGGTLQLAEGAPQTLDPALSQDVGSWQYILQIFSGLVRLDPSLKVVPDVASSWSVSDDGRTYTFTLRDDAQFSDGHPVTADDFKYSLERALAPETNSPVALVYLGDIVGATDFQQGKTKSVAGIVAKDPKTLQITIDAPKSYFLAKLSYSTAFVVERANVQSGPDWFKHPIGSGPFTLKEWTPGSRLVLARNPRYYGVKPSVGEIDFDLTNRSPMQLYENGQLDSVSAGLGDYDRVTDPENPLHNQLTVSPMLSVQYIGLNVRMKPFDDPKVRQAFAYATDKHRIIHGLYDDMFTEAKGMLPPGLPGYDASFQGIGFDQNKARQLLSESSYGSADKLPPIVLSVPEGTGSIAESYAAMYKQTLGVNVQVQEIQEGFFDSLASRSLQMYYLGWVADYPDPQDFIDILFYSGSDGNYTGYSNPQVDHLIEQARTGSSLDARVALYRQAQQQIIDDAPVIPIYHDTQYRLIRPGVTGLIFTPLGTFDATGVKIQTPAKPLS